MCSAYIAFITLKKILHPTFRNFKLFAFFYKFEKEFSPT